MYSGRIKRGGSTASSMDFVSAVLSLSQKRDDRNADSGRASCHDEGVREDERGLKQEGKEEQGMRHERRFETWIRKDSRKKRVKESEARATEEGWKNAKRRERAGIRRNKRGIFVPATNPNGEKRTFLFSFTRQPTSTYLYVRGLRGLMSPGTLPKIEWLTLAQIYIYIY